MEPRNSIKGPKGTNGAQKFYYGPKGPNGTQKFYKGPKTTKWKSEIL